MTLIEAKAKRDALVLEKRTVETKLAAIKNLVRCSGRMTHEKYKQCCDSQTAYTRKIIAIESQILPLKAEIQKLADAEHAAHVAANGGSTNGEAKLKHRDVVIMLREVRDKWQEFSADDALGNGTERTLAAQFVRDLNPVIHAILDSLV